MAYAPGADEPMDDPAQGCLLFAVAMVLAVVMLGVTGLLLISAMR